MLSNRTRNILWGLGIICFGVLAYKVWPVVGFKSISYGSTTTPPPVASEPSDQVVPAVSPDAEAQTPQASPLAPTAQVPVTHIPTPSVVKAIYISSWVAGSPSIRD